jgi:acetoacetyl-CoA synthetase
VLGLSSSYLTLCGNAGLTPGADHDLSNLREVFAAGSVLPLEGYAFIHERVKKGVYFFTGSGGSEICSAFVSGNPLTQVKAGCIPSRMLGVDAHAVDADGTHLIDQPGELVIEAPMPSMPLFLWGDSDSQRFSESYFSRYPNTWHHGDRFILHSDGSCELLGRSDAVLNRGGVRLGVDELYSVVEQLDFVADSVVVHVADSDDASGKLVLFVVKNDDGAITDEEKQTIGSRLRQARSPRHVPDIIVEVEALPRTLSGKKVEVMVKRVLEGEPVGEVAAEGSLENYAALVDIAAWHDERTKASASGTAA